MTMKGAVVAAAVAGLFATVSPLTAQAKTADGATVHCAGINACKGQGKCSGGGHGCAGMNSCKGKGWIETTAKECKAKKGTIAK